MSGIISVDSFTLLEYMAAHAIKDGEAFFYADSALTAAKGSNLKYKDPRKMSEYTRALKDSGVIEHHPKGGWIIHPEQMEHTTVRDMNASVAELILIDSSDFSNAVERVSNDQLAVAIARELFNRLTVAQFEAKDAYQRALMTITEEQENNYKSEVSTLMQKIEDEVAARRAAELAAQTYKGKADKLELQVSALMREVASAKDGDEIREAARRFFRTDSDGERSVSVGSPQPSQ